MTTAHYSTLEAAYLAVARLRNEGYVASVCDDAVATIWGPLAVGGVRVVSSDEPIEGVDRIAGCSSRHRGGTSPLLARFAVIAIFSVAAVCAVFVLLELVADNSIIGVAHLLVVNALRVICLLFLAASLAPWIHDLLARSLLRSESRKSATDYLLTAIGVALAVAISWVL